MVGLDPRWEQLPEEFSQDAIDTLSGKADAYERFCRDVIDVVAPLVSCVKPQAAFFEALGPDGMNALGNVVDYANSKGLIVIMDAKRGDIGSTAAAYAAAFLGPKPTSGWGCDALTVNPYLGEDSLQPFVDRARETGSGLFVLCKTSNPGSATFQEKICGGQPVFELVAQLLNRLAAEDVGASGYSSIGAVIGATYPEQLIQLRQSLPNTFFLVPGFGAQGGTAADISGSFDDNGTGAVINSSRGIIFAYRRPEYESLAGYWQRAVEQATLDAIEQIAEHTSAGRLINR